jgi:hypothetical protein
MRLIDADALLLEFGEEPLNWTNSDSEIQAQRDYKLFTKIVKGAPIIDIKTEVAREIFEEIYKTTASVYNEYVRTTGSVRGMNYAFVINLEHAIAELENKYTKEGVGE